MKSNSIHGSPSSCIMQAAIVKLRVAWIVQGCALFAFWPGRL